MTSLNTYAANNPNYIFCDECQSEGVGKDIFFFVDLSSPWTASIESVVCSYIYRSACETQWWWNCSHPDPAQEKPLPAVPRSLAESRFLLQQQPSWSILPSICLPGRATRTGRDGTGDLPAGASTASRETYHSTGKEKKSENNQQNGCGVITEVLGRPSTVWLVFQGYDLVQSFASV